MASARREIAMDVVLTAFLVVFSLLGTGPAAENQHQSPSVVAYVLAVAAAIAMVGWHRRPLWTFAAVGTASVVYLGGGYAYGPIMVTLALATYGVCVRSTLRRSLTAGSVLLAAAELAVGVAVLTGRRDWAELVSAAAWIVLPGAFGIVIRTRREASSAVRSAQARRAVSEERLRLAQEVHDVAGHGFAVIAMQAGVALRILDRDPAGVRAALEAIRTASTEALDELRAEVQALREGPGLAPLRPHTGLGDLPALAERMRASGLPITVDSTVDADGLRPEVDQAGYRILQESLTNVLRHAGPDATATVRVRPSDGWLELEVIDTGRGPGGAAADGSGIVGMRGRAEALGGTLVAEPGPTGGFGVYARLPLSPPGRQEPA